MAGPGDSTEHIRAKQRAKDARKREYQALVAKAKKNGGATITPPPKNKGMINKESLDAEEVKHSSDGSLNIFCGDEVRALN